MIGIFKNFTQNCIRRTTSTEVWANADSLDSRKSTKMDMTFNKNCLHKKCICVILFELYLLDLFHIFEIVIFFYHLDDTLFSVRNKLFLKRLRVMTFFQIHQPWKR